MALPISSLTAAVLTTLLVVLSLRVVAFRRANRVSLGDGGDERLLVMIRGQGNLAEYGPIGVLLVLIAELQGANPFVLGVLAAAFALGRLAHGYAFGFRSAAPTLRVAGMQLTIWGLLALAGLDVVLAILSLA